MRPTSSADELLAKGEYARAAEEYDRLLRADPNDGVLLSCKGICLLKLGDPQQASVVLRASLKRIPGTLGVMLALASAQRLCGDLLRALSTYEEAIRKSPKDPFILTTAGSVAFDAGRTAEAISLTNRALAIRPDNPVALRNLASMVAKSGDPAVAVEVGRRLARLEPSPPVLTPWVQHHLLGNALVANEAFEEGIAEIRAALDLAGGTQDQHDIRHSLAIALLSAGRLGEGLKMLDARLELPNYRGGAIPTLSTPRWDGGSVPECGRLLVVCEQGAGDTVAFLRFLPQALKRAGRVVVLARPGLAGLLRQVDGVEVSEQAMTDGAVPDHAAWVGMLDLPGTLGVPESAAVYEGTYVRADAARVAYFREKVRKVANGRKCVGVCWSGNPSQPVNGRRSLPSSLLGTLRSPGVCLVSLQKQVPEGNAAGRKVFDVDLMGEVGDFADTAAMLAAVDQVVTTDTSTAHLAGAMGLEAWVLLHTPGPHWMWGCSAERTPWYPSLRLLRQRAFGQWDAVVERVRADLR